MVTVVCLVHVLHIRVPSTCMWSINTLAVANEIFTCMLSFPLAVRTFLIKIRVIGLQPEYEKLPPDQIGQLLPHLPSLLHCIAPLRLYFVRPEQIIYLARLHRHDH